MARATAPRPPAFRESLRASFAVNDRINQLLIERLPPHAWRAKPPAPRVRTIAAIFAHMHNIRRKWLRLSSPHLKLPPHLDRGRCTQKQTKAALAESALRCSEMIVELSVPGSGRGRPFRRDAWAKPWPGGFAMVAYMLAHEAHHRGQICMLAHQMGFRLPTKVTSEMWAWERLWKQCAFSTPR